MKRSSYALVLFATLGAAACGPSRVLITAELEVPDPEREGATMLSPLAGLEVQFLPFDRDAVFDSLAKAFPTPEPPIPEDLLETQRQIAAAQDAWRQAEGVWAAGRDRLLAITEEMKGLARAEPRYRQLFAQFQEVEGQVARAERAKETAFRNFTELQKNYIRRADSVRILREQWEDEAFADAGTVFAAKIKETKKKVMADTTDAQGKAGPVPLPVGRWWVHARYALPFEELYWNIPIEARRGDPMELALTRQTAQIRPKL